MIIKNRDAYQNFLTLKSAHETGLLGFAIAKNTRKMADELMEYDQKRSEMLAKYGEDMGDGRFRLTMANTKRYSEEMAPYDGIEFEWEPVTVSEEVFCGGNLTSDQMYALMWMVKE